MRYENGNFIGWDFIIKATLDDDVHIWVILKEDLALIEAEQMQLEKENKTIMEQYWTNR